MPRVLIAPALARWIEPAARELGEWRGEATGATVREVLTDLVRQLPMLKGYVLDETGTIRHHVVVYVDGSVVRDKLDLSGPVPADGEVQIFQALSGG
jgi:sulfur-carrier protein